MAEDNAPIDEEIGIGADVPSSEDVPVGDDAGGQGDASGDPSGDIRLLASQLEQMMDMNKRLQADFDNYRRRMEREKDSIAIFANERLIKGLLPILDNFDRAITAVPEGESSSLLDGILLVRKQLFSELEKVGVQEIQAAGAPFDPNFHEAVGFAPADGVDEDTVVEEYQKGYTLGGRLLRAAVVRVAKG